MSNRETRKLAPLSPALRLDEPEPSTSRFTLQVVVLDEVLETREFCQEVVRIGREDDGSDVVLDNLLVSRRHAEIRRNGEIFALIDLKSPNGTFVNGRRVKDLCMLNDGDEIIVGKFQLRFSSMSVGGFDVEVDQEQLEVSEIDHLGGATLQMSKRMQNRVVRDAGRKRGYVLLPRDPKPIRFFIAEGFQVGKSPDCDLRLQGWFVPRKALIIVRGHEDYRAYNVAPNPKVVKVNGALMLNQKVLTHGDRITVCGLKFEFTVAEREDPAKGEAASKRDRQGREPFGPGGSTSSAPEQVGSAAPPSAADTPSAADAPSGEGPPPAAEASGSES